MPGTRPGMTLSKLVPSAIPYSSSATIHLGAIKISLASIARGRSHGTPRLSEICRWICRRRRSTGGKRAGGTAAAAAARKRTAAAFERRCPACGDHRKRGRTAHTRTGALAPPLALAPPPSLGCPTPILGLPSPPLASSLAPPLLVRPAWIRNQLSPLPNSAAKRFSPVREKLTTRLPGAESRAAHFSSVKRVITAAPSVPAR